MQDLLGRIVEQEETPPRELTLDEAVELAILLQKNDQLAAASELFSRVLETAPDHSRALHYAGVLAHQEGRSDDAIALIEKSLTLEPDSADCYSNLGIVLQSVARLEAAIDAVVLTVIRAPLLWWTIVRPLTEVIRLRTELRS